MDNLTIIGQGPGDESLLTDKAKKALASARKIFNTREMPLSELYAALENPGGGSEEATPAAHANAGAGSGGVAVLVSGDCGFFSVAKKLLNDFSDRYEIDVIPGISSIQYMSAKIKTPYDDAVIISMHGRDANIVAKAAYNKKVFALTGGANSAGEICRTLSRFGLGAVKVIVGERLSYRDERIMSGNAAELQDAVFHSLSVMYIENPSAANPHTPLGDDDFVRGGVPMTKAEVRWLSIQKLCIDPRDIVFDIGAGTGSVAIEAARKAYDGFVYAIEAKGDACALIRANAIKHGAYNMEIVRGEAPDAFDNLPAPDKAFIGGSSGKMGGIIKKLLTLNPNVKITANAVSLQTVGKIIACFEQYEIADTDIICVNIAKSKKTGGYDIMTAQNPVYIISGAGSGIAAGGGDGDGITAGGGDGDGIADGGGGGDGIADG